MIRPQLLNLLLASILSILMPNLLNAAQVIPFKESLWEIRAKSTIIENYKQNDAIYIQQGAATLKDVEFLNGTIEFDVYLTPRQSFPGVYFRQFDEQNNESFFLRPHLSGKPDANQAAPTINGLVAWQIYFGSDYSFPYEYNFEGWTHIKLLVNDDKAQVYLDYSDTPHLSWHLKHKPQAGRVSIGGGFAPVHYANFTIDHTKPKLINFVETKKQLVKDIITEWQISDKFDEKELNNLPQIQQLISARKWQKTVSVEETSVANISWVQSRYQGDGNTVFAKVTINTESDMTRIFDFGYSDRAVVLLNGKPLYRGNNKWRSRDYRYLGTVGLFDSVYLNLKKGKNTLLIAVSEDFGGWAVTGKFRNMDDLIVIPE